MIFARRIVAQRCLYGVDKNPLAAEMAKLSLWLLTLQKDKPFTFLDHAIRSGDSLVGIANTHQLTSFSLDGEGIDMPMFTDAIKSALQEVRLVRRQLSELPDNSADDVQKKALMLRNAEEQTKRLTYAANCLLVASWESTSETDREERVKQALLQVENSFNDLAVEQIEAEDRKQLQKAGCPKPFHWPLEFPEVFMDRGGFDGIVGNPPFIGGARVSAVLGDDYLAFILRAYSRTSGNGDLVAFFVRRGAQLLRSCGLLGVITTNSIAQGTTREGSLDYLAESGYSIPRAIKSTQWPGAANVYVSIIHLFRGGWEGDRYLDDQCVASISPYLDHEEQPFVPARIPSNLKTVFRGSTISGEGFILNCDEVAQIRAAEPRCSEVIKPFLTGQDVNQNPRQSSKRYAIDLGNLNEESARKYGPCWDRLYNTVRLQRVGNKIKQRVELWWQYIGRQEALYAAIAEFERVLVCGQVSKYWAVSWVQNGQVFADKVVVFALNNDAHFSILNSCFHTEWAEKTSSRLKEDPNYNLAATFETFPRPTENSTLTTVGKTYDHLRCGIMLDRDIGLTSTYNLFHDTKEASRDIQKLRDLHVEMDKAVAAAYGWSDLDLGHGFHETKQGLRFTISEAARREVLARLLRLNHKRYAEEVKQGLHNKKKGGGKNGGKNKSAEGPTLF